jgi:hypothetical protein
MWGGRVAGDMHSWEIVCIEVDEDSDYDDCRAITTLGYRAPSLRKKDSDVVGARIHQGHSRFHLEVDGERVQLQADRSDDVHFYARTLDEDSPEDPLLQLGSCTQYEREEHLEEVS